MHTPAERLRALVVREPGGVRIGDLPIRLGVRPEEVEPLAADAGLLSADGAFVAAGRVEEAATDALRRVTAFHKLHAAESGLPLETLRQAMTGFGAAGVAALDRLLALGRLVSAGGLVRDAEFRATAAGGDAALDRLVRAVEAGGLTPPTIPELEAALGLRGAADALRLAARQGRAVPVERDRYFAPAVLAEFAVTLRTIGAAGPITPPLVRDATGLSRKFLIPLLEWADQQGITRREGEARRLLPPR